jgi:hypothetical protein
MFSMFNRGTSVKTRFGVKFQQRIKSQNVIDESYSSGQKVLKIAGKYGNIIWKLHVMITFLSLHILDETESYFENGSHGAAAVSY